MKPKWVVAILLLIVLGMVWRQTVLLPSNSRNVIDSNFRSTLAQNNDSFSVVSTKSYKGFSRAFKPQKFSFPSDHGPHNRFRSEWWYFTGNLNATQGRRFGYELTFFRSALKPDILESKSAWRTNQMYMAHLALTDVETNRFYTDERFSRAGNDLADASDKSYQVWLYDWSAKTEGEEDFPLRLHAKSVDFAIDLLLTSSKGLVLQGDQGLSRKSPEPGNASYYYSYPRLETEGMISVGGKQFSVTGTSWMDREWSTSALSNEQSGWDWFALQLSDNTELMFYQLRRKDGQLDGNSSGSYIKADNTKLPLKGHDVIIKTLDSWESPHSAITYPSRWRLSVPSHYLELEIVPLIKDQELNVSYRYWEGAVKVTGTKQGRVISGFGYVELNGYKS
ncbi:MAG: carotenoid 1,2-hydratase [Methylococcaceae bacterium]|nr:carotenoid 1,2-hydratase [Methylococcaceae bacterium]